jgi:putative IMPACT (imprinted ancient) family translation regulator
MRVTEQIPEQTLTLQLGFADEQPLRHWCDQHGARLEDIQYSQHVTARVTAPEQYLDDLRAFCAAHGIGASHHWRRGGEGAT